MSKILSDVFQKSPSVFLSLRALGRSPPVPQLELGPRGARSGSGASARPSLSPAPGMLPIFPAGICSRALASRSAVSDGGGRRRAEPEGRGRESKAAARWQRDRDPALPGGGPCAAALLNNPCPSLQTPPGPRATPRRPAPSASAGLGPCSAPRPAARIARALPGRSVPAPLWVRGCPRGAQQCRAPGWERGNAC